jgi:hypothetical protein
MQEDNLDTMQVCMEGHLINPNFEDYPAFSKAFCPTCGEATIIACPECKVPIRGFFRGYTATKVIGDIAAATAKSHLGL